MSSWLTVLGLAALLMPLACAGGCADGGRSSLPVECVPRGGVPNFLDKAARGDRVRIAYLGGSITKSPGWRTMTLEWFERQHPEAAVEGINAGISGTGSELGVFRLEHDCLRHEPDLLFVEFAVNDGGTSAERIEKSMEGIVRQAWRARPDVDICFVYTLTQGALREVQRGELPRTVRAHEAVAARYGIPTILMGREAARLEAEGKLVFTGRWPQSDEERAALGDRILFSGDGVHPYDAGHRLYADAVARSIASMKGIGQPGPHQLPEPLRPDNFEFAKPIPLDRAQLSSGWRSLDLGDAGVRDLLRETEFGDKLDALWVAEEPGESISFRFRGTSVMMYDLIGPDCAQIIVTIDGQERKIIPRFDSWGERHRVTVLRAATDLPDEVHAVRFEIHPEQPDRAKLLAERGITMDEPERYDGTRWYVGYILVTGKVLR